jgi:hypothetical protein
VKTERETLAEEQQQTLEDQHQAADIEEKSQVSEKMAMKNDLFLCGFSLFFRFHRLRESQ